MDCSRAWGKGPGGVSGGVAERRVPDLPALPVAMMVVVGGGVGGGGCLDIKINPIEQYKKGRGSTKFVGDVLGKR
ncbi:hypothetical protein HZH66_015116 [Vespula vulgaris]|uniref:Uncharacterized protein n=1 Tax=Vespula vulgaris TaxID=7454 RepID=A0A834J1D4_VESVU|nr:hypothetical protein HZH66_015116 [Vespula vulgaris]